MKTVTFKGGIHPPYNKECTNSGRIIPLAPGEKLYIPLLQHIGATCNPLVKKGDYVKMYQKIGDSEAFVSSPVHSGISGTVVDIKKHLHPNGTKVETVIIENDFNYEKDTSLKPDKTYEEMTAEEIIDLTHRAGIVGMGGAGFPVHIKLSPPKDKHPEYIIINGAECEPYLSSDHLSMLNYADDIIYGIKVLLKATGAGSAIIAIEDNKRDAEQVISEKLTDIPEIKTCLMKTKYPQGSEKHVIKAVLGREVPSGALPIDAGVIVNNIDTCIAIANVMLRGIPVTGRRVTVSGGAVVSPGVFEATVGTPIQELIDACGGLSADVHKLVMGGPMMGTPLFDTDVPVIKTTSGVLALNRSETKRYSESPCLRCGKCVEACPMGLMPLEVAEAGRREDGERAVSLHANDCIECGSCSYICPAGRFIVENIKLAKANAMAILRNK